MSRNKQFDLMLAFGIIFVVLGHVYQPPSLFYPAYSFHIPLFFFISGYFFSIKTSIREKLSWSWHKTKSQLLAYFALNTFFAILYLALLKYDVITGQDITIHNFFVEPFMHAHQFWLLAPAWFLITLYLSSILLQLVLWKKNKTWILAVLALFVCINLYSLNEGLQLFKNYKLTLVKTAFGSLFMLFGLAFKQFEDKVQKTLYNPITLILIIVLIDVLRENWGNMGSINLSISDGSVQNIHAFIPVLTSLLIIFLIYTICHLGTYLIKDNSIILSIGRGSFSIMSWHLFAFLVVDLILLIFGKTYIGDLCNVYSSYQPHKFWFFYASAGILLPLFFLKTYKFSIRIYKSKILPIIS